MKLYYTPSACSMAPHIMLHEQGQTFQIESVDLKTHRTASGVDFYTINPKGYVPALKLDNGKILSENIAILSYIDDLGQVKDDRFDRLEWLAFISTEVHKTLGSLFGLKEGPEAVVKAIKDRAGARFNLLEKHLANREFILDQFSSADAYLFTVINWCPYLGIDLKAWPHLAAFHQRLSARPSIVKAMKAEGLIK